MYGVDGGAHAACGTLPSDDREDGGMCDVPRAATSHAAAPAGAATTSGKRVRQRDAVANAPAAPSPQPLLSLRGPDGSGAAAPAVPQKRRRAGEGSAGEPENARGPQISREDLGRLSALAVTLRDELLHRGVSADELSLRCLSFREDHLPSFPVIVSGAWARLAPASLTSAVMSVLRDKTVPPLEGLWKAVVKGSYHFQLSYSS